MELHAISNTPGARKGRKRVGHGSGSGRGKTCGKGHKGQMARKGHKRKRGFEGGQMPLIRRLPKGGFRNPCRRSYVAVNVEDLERFDADTEVTAGLLRSVGLVSGSADGVKILGSGELSKKLTVKASAFSAMARSKIEAVGGSCEVTSD